MATKPQKKQPSKTSKKKQNKPEISRTWSIWLFGITALFFALTYIKGQNYWSAMRTYGMFGVFGITSYLVAPAFMYLAILVAFEKPVKKRVAQVIFAIVLASALIQVFYVGYTGEELFKESVKYLYITGCDEVGGGALAVLLGWTLVHYFGPLAAKVCLLILTAACLMLLTQITPAEILEFLQKIFGDASNAASEKVNERRILKEEKAKQKEYYNDEEPIINRQAYNIAKEKHEASRIDIPLDNNKGKARSIFGFGKKSAIDVDLGPDTTAISKEIQPETEKVYLGISGADEENVEIHGPIDEIDVLTEKAILVAQEANTIAAKDTIIPRQLPEEKREYVYPEIELFDETETIDDRGVSAELRKNAELLVSTLESFGVKTKVLEISRGPSVTRYELQPSAGVKISRITGLADDIALALATAGVRIEAPIPNKAAVGIEVPNKKSNPVGIRSVFESNEYKKSNSPLVLPLGKDIAGVVRIADLTRMPHILIAGSTGSGKSVCINGIIISILYNTSPEQVRMILIDPKVVELSEYNGVPHLLMPVVTDPAKAAGALGVAVGEMEKRYIDFAENGVRDITSFNKLASQYGSGLEPKPYIAIIIDELADLMMAAGKKVEDYICRLAQKARAAGIHLIVATQRPSVDVITGLIKANIPSRIAFAVSSQIDSRTILDGGGAEKLLGMGDMLFLPVGESKPIRIQGSYVKDGEITRVINKVKENTTADYDEEMIEKVEKITVEEVKAGGVSSGDGEDYDLLLEQAIEVVVNAGQASTSLLQRRLKVGYARAARIMDEMEENGIIGPYEGSKPRQILITRQQWIERSMNID